MILDLEQRFQRAVDRLSQPTVWPPEYPEKAKKIQEAYDKARYGTSNPPPAQWEFAAQMASKLAVVMAEPDTHDPNRSKQKWYSTALEQFDLTTGRFPEGINPRTGEPLT